jgi:triacylglycerol esterase/lipase EstA (alpha/beta hydrolase family)
MQQIHRRLLAAAGAAALSLTVAGVSPAGAATQAEPVTGPYQLNFSAALIYSLIYPDAEAVGVNDWGCTPKAGTQPVVLVHGTFANQYNSFARMAPELTRAGYCVYSFNYGTDGTDAAAQLPGVYGTTGLSGNGDELAAFAATVRQRTGFDEVDMVGWSQGGTIITDVLKKHGGAGVDDVVTYGATHHGTTASGLATIAKAVGATDLTRAGLGQAAVDQIRGSDYITALTADGDTVPGVDYTVVATKYDEVTTPYDSTFLEAGPGATVRNITLQTGCGIDLSDHLSMTASPRLIDITKRALDPQGRGYLRCLPNAPIL